MCSFLFKVDAAEDFNMLWHTKDKMFNSSFSCSFFNPDCTALFIVADFCGDGVSLSHSVSLFNGWALFKICPTSLSQHKTLTWDKNHT